MVFNSFDFLVFFIGVAALYFAVPYRRRWLILLGASYSFLLSWKPEYALLLVIGTLCNWALALRMPQEQAQRKLLLTVGITFNLSILFFYKYFDFVSTSLWSLFNFANDPLVLQLALPIGISFYTFQSLAYLIDVYKKIIPAERSFFRYATFIAFFPHLVSGPILRPSNMLPQIHERKEWDSDNLKIGLFCIATGLIKKLVIADRLGVFVNEIYMQPELYSGATLLVATYFFAFQIYCDFSGYTDIAIGLARILGYTIPDNFRQPYFSQSVSEFWRRWHISLSSWLRDYVYVPLTFSGKRTQFRLYLSTVVTFVLIGIWHGANWTFVIFGALHALFVVVETLIGQLSRSFAKVSSHPLMVALRIALVFNLVSLGWIFFRAESVHDAFLIIQTIFTHFGTFQTSVIHLSSIAFYGLLIAGLLAFDFLEMRTGISQKILALPWYFRWGLTYGVIFGLIFFGAESGIQFIYFQF